MTSVPTTLCCLTSFDFAQGIGFLPVWVNPAHVAYVQARRRHDTNEERDVLTGTLLYFQQEAGVLAVRESVDEVLAALQVRTEP